MLVYLNPHTKDFAFVKTKKCQDYLNRVTKKAAELAAKTVLKPPKQQFDDYT